MGPPGTLPWPQIEYEALGRFGRRNERRVCTLEQNLIASIVCVCCSSLRKRWFSLLIGIA